MTPLGRIIVILRVDIKSKKTYKYSMTEKEFAEIFPQVFEKGKKYILSKYNIDYGNCQDILQNASLKAFKNLPSFEGRSSFSSWFTSILINEVKSFLLSEKKHKAMISSDVDLLDYSYSFQEPEITKNQEKEFSSFFIYKSLSKLNKKQKNVINLLLKEKTQAQISKKLKIPISSVRTRIFYAKKNMRKFLSSYEFYSKS